MKITEDVRKYAAEQDVAEEAGLAADMDEKKVLKNAAWISRLRLAILLAIMALGVGRVVGEEPPPLVGRLVISIIGAGEYPVEPDADMNLTVPGDKHAVGGASHLLQFMSGDEKAIRVQHIVVTSDPDITTWVKGLQFAK